MLAVKTYVATEAATASLTGTSWQTITASRQMPKFEKLGSNVAAYIGRVNYKEMRLAGPRGLGEKQRDYTIDLVLEATASNEVAGGDEFDSLIEAVGNVFAGIASSTFPIALTDAETAATSNLHSIGESFDVERRPAETTEQQGRVRFLAVITLQAVEILAAR
ncbi:MAG: hypothetical protein ACYDAY_11425 [Candidatus Dormibacteria bacterium]